MILRPALFCAAILAAGCTRSGPRVVVYCAHDREFSEDILRDFEKQTGIEVAVRFDSEANKSVGLYEDLMRERDNPRCDVHWNNEVLATIRLQRAGVLAPYDSPAAKDLPRADDKTWTAFAARARVLIVNRKLLSDPAQVPASMLELTSPRWKGKLAMAKPQFGMTASHAAWLFSAWGGDAARDFFRALKANDVHILPGNKQVAVAVGQGRFPLGLTDTDDALAEIEAGNPVQMIFIDNSHAAAGFRHGPLLIPNTVALIQGSPNPAQGKKLIDYLLSPAVEARLAQTKSRQLPLNPAVKGPAGFPSPHPFSAAPFRGAVDRWDETQRFLADEFGLR